MLDVYIVGCFRFCVALIFTSITQQFNTLIDII